MKISAIISISTLGLLLGTSAPANAQQGHQGDSRHQQENDHQRGRSSDKQSREQKHEQHSQEHSRAAERKSAPPRHQADRPERRSEATERDRSRRQESYRPAHPSEPRGHERGAGPRDVWQSHRAQHWQREHHAWRERGGYHGYRIPEDRFRAHFGRGHWFRVHRLPIIVVDRYPRFQYEGFWFSLVDPWPEYWSPTWYETDDVYVDYVNDGYYMYNRRHPGIAIAVSVSF